MGEKDWVLVKDPVAQKSDVNAKAIDKQCSPDSSCLFLRLPEESRIEAGFPTFSSVFILFCARLGLDDFSESKFSILGIAFYAQTLGGGTGPVHLEAVCFVWRGGGLARRGCVCSDSGSLQQP